MSDSRSAIRVERAVEAVSTAGALVCLFEMAVAAAGGGGVLLTDVTLLLFVSFYFPPVRVLQQLDPRNHTLEELEVEVDLLAQALRAVTGDGKIGRCE